MAFNFSPIFNGWQFFTPSGLPLSGGFLNTYLAGTSTPANTYTTRIGNVPNSNPIALLADGRTPQEIWLDSTLAYKFVLTDSLLNQIGTYDNIVGIDNSAPAALTEWVLFAPAPSFVNATTFTLAGNQMSLFEVGRRVLYTLGAGQYTGSITASVFGAITTVTLATDAIPLDGTLSAVAYGFLDALKPSVPTAFVSQVTAPSAIFQTLSIPAGGLLPGTYVPTLTNNANISASSAQVAQYFRGGNVIIVSGAVNITSTAANLFTILYISLPVPSNFATGFQCAGTATRGLVIGPVAPLAGVVLGVSPANVASLGFVSDAVGTSAVWAYQFTYLVI